jgi:hypothetical protein
MKEGIYQIVKRIYSENDFQYFQELLKNNEYNIEEGIKILDKYPVNIVVENRLDSPSFEWRIEHDTENENNKLKYYSVIRFSKIGKYYNLMHEFELNNPDREKIEPKLRGNSEEPYSMTQFKIENDISAYLERQGFERLYYGDMTEVFGGIPAPTGNLYGTQMTVENCLFRDLYELIN